jgi:hypothetical protein
MFWNLASIYHHVSSVDQGFRYLFGSLFAGGFTLLTHPRQKSQRGFAKPRPSRVFVFAECAMDRSIIGADPTFCVEDIEKAQLGGLEATTDGLTIGYDIMGISWRFYPLGKLTWLLKNGHFILDLPTKSGDFP